MRQFLTFIGAPAALLSVAGLAGGYWWVLDLASHFRVQYFAVLAVSAAVLLLCRAYRTAFLFAAAALLNAVLIYPLYTGGPETLQPDARVLRAMQINVHTANTGYDAVLGSVTSHNPDFVLLEEVDARWLAGLGALSQTYPHVIARPRNDNFGIALFSKHPFADSQIVVYGPAGVPSVLAMIDLEGASFYLLGTHPLPPVSRDYAERRDQQLLDIANAARGLDKPVLLLGDLNVSPWSYHFKRLLRRSGLRDGARGMGFQPSWPTGVLPLSIPIDHSLHSPGIAIANRVIGQDVGSDHFPLIVDFMLAPAD
jgi:endonuclease/exonuclease/phosphatase (EEP) superfamily protein YafD